LIKIPWKLFQQFLFSRFCASYFNYFNIRHPKKKVKKTYGGGPTIAPSSPTRSAARGVKTQQQQQQ
jgi:hypothetical protein